MSAYGAEESLRSPMTSGAKRGSEDEGVMGAASLEVACDSAASVGGVNGPTLYHVVYTRGGWIWRTSHRFSEWLSLKERLRTDFEARNLPDDKMFPQKEDVGAIVTKLLTSCQGCREGGGRHVGILEDRRRGLQAYFSSVLDEQRELWDSSDDIKAFFFPGPPTSYSAALSRRRSEQLKEDKLKAKEAASATSKMTSSLKSTLGSLFESKLSLSPKATTTTATPTPRESFFSASSSFARSTSLSSSSAAFSPARNEDRPAAGAGRGAMGAPSPSVLNRLAAMKKQMPSLRDLLFVDNAAETGSASGSRASSRDGGGGGAAVGGGGGGAGSSDRHMKFSSINKPPSESGVTDPDGGISEAGGSMHSSNICE